MAASRWDIYRKLRFPASVPFLFTALKVAATWAIIGAIIGLVTGILSALWLEFLETTDSSVPARRNVDAIAAMLKSDVARLSGRGGRRDAA